MDTSRVKQLLEDVKTEQSPGKLADIMTELSSWYATLGQELEDALVFKADRWMSIREMVKSNVQADRMWDKSDLGKKEIRLRIQLKYIEKVISSIKLRLKIKQDESWGRF